MMVLGYNIYMKKIIKQFCDFLIKYRYKVWITGVFLVIWIFGFGDFAYAEGAADNSGSQFILEMYLAMTIIIKFLWRIWVLLANVAGKFMTNSMVTWEWLWLAETLYGYHKYIQSLSRLIMVVIILKSIISNAVMDYKPEKIIDVVKNWIFASVGIYFCRWLIWILISISNILFLAISDLGNNLIMQTNSNTVNQIAFSIPSSIDRDVSKTNENNVLNQEATTSNDRNIIDSICALYDLSNVEIKIEDPKQVTIESLLPNPWDLSGPFIYFGFGIFRFNSIVKDDALGIDSLSKANILKYCGNLDENGKLIWSSGKVTDEDLDNLLWSGTMSNIKNKLLSLMIMFANIFIFTLALVTIIVMNFLRMIFIWMLLVFSPIIVLWWVFGRKGVDDKIGQSISKAAENIWAGSLSSLIWLILQPVVSIFWLSIAMFFINSIYASFTNFQTPEQSAQMSNQILHTAQRNKESEITFDNGSSVNIQGSFINDSVWAVGWGIGYVLMSIMTLYILWMIVKVSGNFSKAVWKYTDAITKKASNFIFDEVKIGWASLWAITWAGGTSDKNLKNELKWIWEWNFKSNVNDDYDIAKSEMQRLAGITTPDIGANTAKWLTLKDGGIKSEDNEMKKYINEKDVKKKRELTWQLNKTKKQTIDYFKTIKSELYEKKGQKFEFKAALKTQEAIVNWLKTWWLLFMHNAYGVDLEKDLSLTKEQIDKPSTIDFESLLGQKNQIWAFVNNMLTNDSFMESFAKDDTKFNESTWAFNDNKTWDNIKWDNKKSASWISFDIPKK